MHEWALAEAVVQTALDVLKKENGKQIIEITLVIGKLQTIDMDAFSFALTELSKDTPMHNTKINFEYESPAFKCLYCGHEWTIDDLEELLDETQIEAIHFIPELSHTFIRCPKCGSVDFEITKGRGIWIKSLKIEG